MSNDRQLSIGIGIAQGLNNAVNNFYAVRQARQKLREEEEMFSMNKKIASNQLQLQEQQLDPDVYNEKKKQLRLETQNAELALRSNKLKNQKAEEEITFDMDAFFKLAGNLPPGMSVSRETSVGTVKAQGPKVNADLTPKVLSGIVEQKDVYSEEEREAAKNEIRKRLGLSPETEEKTPGIVDNIFNFLSKMGSAKPVKQDAGAYFGGPTGAAAGYKLGSAAGSAKPVKQDAGASSMDRLKKNYGL